MTKKCNSKTESFHKQRVEFDCKFFKGKDKANDECKIIQNSVYNIRQKYKQKKDHQKTLFDSKFWKHSSLQPLISPLINLLPQYFCHNQLYNTLFYHLQRSHYFCHIFMYFCKNIIPRHFYRYSKTGLDLIISTYVPIFYPMK